ncbi:MAG: hypothetical protein NZ561_04375, partial [Phycisphaerae bacterium]|nr:hypothetical protein [Phycisphaerae bacterium]MDW8262215.1 hypothetical protein [Phycisphaerales bacterium]
SALQNTVMYTTSSGQTTIDVFRHGKYPPKHPTIANTHMATGGKVAYNLLWADGHVTTENDQKAAYLGVRFRFPG